VDDWRYDFLKEDIKRLRNDLSELERRTWKVENWKSLLPFRIWLAACWLVIAGIWIAMAADAAGAL
jgi:hypothetical protein